MSALFRRGLTLSLTILIARPAFALDYDLLFKQMTSSTAVVDTREFHQYQRASSTYDETRETALTHWATQRGAGEISSEYLTATPKNAGISPRRLRRFFEESMLYFAILRAGREEFVPEQIDRWRAFWAEIDLRRLGPTEEARWAQTLLEIYARAAASAGPWSEDEIVRADEILSRHQKSISNGYRRDFRELHKLKEWENPSLKGTRNLKIMASLLVGMPSLASVGSVAVYHGLSALGVPDGLVAGSSFLSLLIIALGSMSTIIFASDVIDRNIPVRASHMFRGGIPTCRALLGVSK